LNHNLAKVVVFIYPNQLGYFSKTHWVKIFRVFHIIETGINPTANMTNLEGRPKGDLLSKAPPAREFSPVMG
jgi:hypothetical protein